jgi:hypothetical protein
MIGAKASGGKTMAARAMTGLSILLGVWAAQASLGADAGRDIPFSLQGWQKVNRNGTPLKIFAPELPNLDFSDGTKDWNIPKSYSFDAKGGRHGGKCLVYYRPDGGIYDYAGITFPVSKLIPGVSYCFGCWIKTEGVGGRGGAGLLVEFGSRYGYMGGITPVEQGKGVLGTTAWKWVEGQFTVPPLAENFVVRPWLTQEAYGKVWFDGIKIYPANPAFVWEAWRIRPIGGVTSDDGKIVIRTEMKGMPLPPPEEVDAAKMRCAINVKQGGRTIVRKIASAASKWIEADLGKLATGDYVMELSLLDGDRKLILAEASEPLRVEAPIAKTAPPKGACTVDERGRCMVDGKPFMPVGLYCYRLDRKNIRDIAQGSFNTVAPYLLLSCNMDSGVDPNKPGAEMKTSNLETVRATLDECHKNGLKVSVPFSEAYYWSTAIDVERFGVSGTNEVIAKTVESFKKHPAVLTWYLADEPQPGVHETKTGKNKVETIDGGAYLKGIYQNIKAMDPWHPIWTVFIGCGVLNHDYRPFIGISDVVSIDVYPIGAKDGHEMNAINLYCDRIQSHFGASHGTPFWAVPQLQNLGSYDYSLKSREDFLTRYRDPTGDEMLGMSLMFAIHGAKGFVFYSYHDLFSRFAAPDFPHRWPEACRVAKTLNSLAPFIMSDVDGPEVEAVFAAGIGSAKGFANDKGKVCVLIAAGVTGGPQEATIKVKSSKALKSKYGLTARNADGSYQFRGKDICYDLLVEE